jgi:hypothetical protein
MFPWWSVLTVLVLPSSVCFAEDTENKILESLQDVPEVRLLSDEQMLADLDQKEFLKKRSSSRNSKNSNSVLLCQHNQKLHEALLAAAKR